MSENIEKTGTWNVTESKSSYYDNQKMQKVSDFLVKITTGTMIIENIERKNKHVVILERPPNIKEKKVTKRMWFCDKKIGNKTHFVHWSKYKNAWDFTIQKLHIL